MDPETYYRTMQDIRDALARQGTLALDDGTVATLTQVKQGVVVEARGCKWLIVLSPR